MELQGQEDDIKHFYTMFCTNEKIILRRLEKDFKLEFNITLKKYNILFSLFLKNRNYEKIIQIFNKILNLDLDKENHKETVITIGPTYCEALYQKRKIHELEKFLSIHDYLEPKSNWTDRIIKGRNLSLYLNETFKLRMVLLILVIVCLFIYIAVWIF